MADNLFITVQLSLIPRALQRVNVYKYNTRFVVLSAVLLYLHISLDFGYSEIINLIPKIFQTYFYLIEIIL